MGDHQPSLVEPEEEYHLASGCNLQQHQCSQKNVGSHTAQFYEDDNYLCCSVSLFILAGLQAPHEAVIIVATQEHCRLIRQRLCAMSVNVEAHEQSRRLTMLNADALLAKFMVNVKPNRELFFTTVGSLVDERLVAYPRLRVYGEMVNVLWSMGNAEGTIALERLWNELGASRPFHLLCGYALSQFDRQVHAPVFDEVCNTHTHVRPAESYEVLNNPDAQLRLIAQLQQKAIALENEIAQHRATERALTIANEELQQAKTTAETANKAKSTFLATISHEVRTPLSAILGYAELLLVDGGDPDRLQEAAQIILRNGKELTRVLNDVLDISKVESGCLKIERIEFPLPELVRDLSSLLNLLARQKGVQLTLRLDGSTPQPSITTDPCRLRQILLNMITNAIKFTDSGGSVEVVFRWLPPLASRRELTLTCTVSDTGCGMTPEQARELFQPFWQADSSISRRYGGTGLGLFLSRQLARLLGGDLVLECSAPQQGSTFVLTVEAGCSSVRDPASSSATNVELSRVVPSPRSAAPPAAAQSATSPPLSASQYPVSILVVDDNLVNVRLLSRLLERAGYQKSRDLATASDGLAALNCVASQHYDIILMDIQMPNMDGHTAARAIRKLYEEQKRTIQPVIIALTADALLGARDKCLDSGMDDYLSKPLDTTVLMDKLARWASVVFQHRC